MGRASDRQAPGDRGSSVPARARIIASHHAPRPPPRPRTIAAGGGSVLSSVGRSEITCGAATEQPPYGAQGLPDRSSTPRAPVGQSGSVPAPFPNHRRRRLSSPPTARRPITPAATKRRPERLRPCPVPEPSPPPPFVSANCAPTDHARRRRTVLGTPGLRVLLGGPLRKCVRGGDGAPALHRAHRHRDRMLAPPSNRRRGYVWGGDGGGRRTRRIDCP